VSGTAHSGLYYDSTDWWSYAECRLADPADFSPKPGNNGFFAARAMCGACPVAAQCLKDALAVEPVMGEEIRFSMFQAGMTPSELQKVYNRKRGIK
jgi:hypothetical protein